MLPVRFESSLRGDMIDPLLDAYYFDSDRNQAALHSPVGQYYELEKVSRSESSFPK